MLDRALRSFLRQNKITYFKGSLKYILKNKEKQNKTMFILNLDGIYCFINLSCCNCKCKDET